MTSTQVFTVLFRSSNGSTIPRSPRCVTFVMYFYVRFPGRKNAINKGYWWRLPGCTDVHVDMCVAFLCMVQREVLSSKFFFNMKASKIQWTSLGLSRKSMIICGAYSFTLMNYHKNNHTVHHLWSHHCQKHMHNTRSQGPGYESWSPSIHDHLS